MSQNRPMLRLMTVVGARPNFMKVAPLVHAIGRANASARHPVHLSHKLVHTGQHYDRRMSDAFFDELNIPDPDHHLGIGSGTHAQQVGQTMIAFERILIDQRPDWVVVVGDVNATLACSITAKKLGIRVAHVEAGLRSFDASMPEEINRMVTDRLSDLHLTTEPSGMENLLSEGVPADRIVHVGNLMIDTLEAQRATAMSMSPERIVLNNGVDGAVGRAEPKLQDGFALVTCHRPSNVDDPKVFGPLVDWLVKEVSEDVSVVWPVHPRAKKQLQAMGLWAFLLQQARMHLLEPLSYRQLLCLNASARLVLTDSGGLQEECCVLGTPCVTMRHNTERPITLIENGGTNRLAGNQRHALRAACRSAMVQARKPFRPECWDGATADRIVSALCRSQNQRVQGAA